MVVRGAAGTGRCSTEKMDPTMTAVVEGRLRINSMFRIEIEAKEVLQRHWEPLRAS